LYDEKEKVEVVGMPNRNQLSDFMKNLAFKILNGRIEIKW